MTAKRIARDVLVLSGFCGAFLILLLLFGRLDADDSDDVIDFSQNRLAADRSTEKKDWQTARDNLERLIARDPYDGRAQFAYASNFYRHRNVEFEKLNSIDPDTSEYAEAAAQVDTLTDNAVRELRKAKEFARYRGRALFFLAVIESEREDFVEALKYLEMFVDTGNFTIQGLDQFPLFGSGGESASLPGAEKDDSTRMHAEGRFWYVVRMERLNRSRR